VRLPDPRLFSVALAFASTLPLACGSGSSGRPPTSDAAGAAGSSAAARAGGDSTSGGTTSEGGASGAAGTLATSGAGNGSSADGGRAGAGNGGAPNSGGLAGAPAGGTSGAGAAGTAGNGGAAGAAGTAGNGGAAGVAGTAGNGGAAGNTASGPLTVLVFSKTAAFRHDSIPDGIAALTNVAAENGWNLSATEDDSVFTDDGLAPLDVVVFLSTTGDVLDDTEQASFERFIRAGKGFVGIHSASDTEYDWAFYGELVGAYFREHPDIQQATLHIEDASDPTMSGLPATWTRTDEWYAFQTNPRPNVHVLITLDETSYSPGSATMGADHPITWSHDYEGGRAFYTALGHTKESYSEPLFVAMLTRAIEWAARR
jgi:type 1 glutamine amidotransferase